jgi:hypothetical protein
MALLDEVGLEALMSYLNETVWFANEFVPS